MSHKITWKKFCETYTISKLQRNLKVTNVKEALSLKTPTIGAITREFGVKKAETYIKLWIINLNEIINVKRPLKDFQIDECAMNIVEDYKHISIADINLIFKNAKKGKYGELYETLSIDKICQWFESYFDERMNVAETLSIQESNSYKVNDRKPVKVINPEMLKLQSIATAMSSVKNSANKYKENP
jgi:hypothetical protein